MSDTFYDVRLKKPPTFHKGFIFCYISSKYSIVTLRRHHNTGKRIVWVHTSYSARAVLSLHVVEL